MIGQYFLYNNINPDVRRNNFLIFDLLYVIEQQMLYFT